MRQPKACDLVHFSEAYPNVDHCSVQIHFHYIKLNKENLALENTEVVLGSEFNIERIAYKNPAKNSDYLINGKISSWKEVTQITQKMEAAKMNEEASKSVAMGEEIPSKVPSQKKKTEKSNHANKQKKGKEVPTSTFIYPTASIFSFIYLAKCGGYQKSYHEFAASFKRCHAYD